MEAVKYKKLHLGCGLNTPEGWLNVDGSWNARLARYGWLRQLLGALRLVPEEVLNTPWSGKIYFHDLRKPLPFSDSSFTEVYASHLLEHLYLEEAKRLLLECYRVLSPDGVLRVVVPDLKEIVQDYIHAGDWPSGDGQDDLPAADELNRRLLLRQPDPGRRGFFYRLYSSMFDFHSHKWMYDADSLIYYFNWAGFIEVSEMGFNDSRIADISMIEKGERVLNGEGICVEGIKSG